MDDKPYKYDATNPRLVTNVEHPSTLMYLTGAIFLGSLYVYNRRAFRIDQNYLNFVLFSGASAFASYQWASVMLNSPINEAGLINNVNELHH